MIVFDVDGTLIGGESTDWTCFEAAFEEVAGFSLSENFFATLEEVTAQAIVHKALDPFPIEKRTQMERAVCAGYLRRLQAAHGADPDCFGAAAGAVALLCELKDKGVPMAIATGDWRETISFKLRAAGIPFDDLPMVTSSEFYSRSEIIAAAVAEAGRPLNEAIYVGDGLWDFRACQKLGIAFIGIGHRRALLLEAGVTHVLHDLSPAAFWQTKEIKKWRGQIADSASRTSVAQG